MSRPTHILKHEHRVIEQGLRALDGLCLKLRTGEAVQPEMMARLFEFFQQFAIRIHHGKEEAHLFPALKHIGVREEGGVLGFLSDEHGLEQRLLGSLEVLVDLYRDGDATASDQFVETAIAFRDHLIGHMQQEDAVLFTLAEEMLDETIKAALLKSFASVGDSEVVKRYELMASELEREWSV
jgi:hemerythrin-like domain-containing protein